MANETQTAPTKGTVIPYLQLDGAMKAAEFYKRAFGAELAAVHPVDDKGRTMHVHLYINNGSLMISDFYPEYGHAPAKPQGFNVTLIVDNVDKWHKRAIEAGATGVMGPQDMFWGDRYAQLRDPFGVMWSLNQPKR
jgi:PhnB protein